MVDWKRISLIGFVVLVLAVLGLLFRQSLFGNGPLTISIQVLSLLLIIWARLNLGMRSFHAAANPTGGKLVTTGPYRFLRHPIYAAVLYFVLAGLASHVSMMNVLLVIAAMAAIAVRIAAEERFLLRYYPEYPLYSSRTKRVIPFIF